MRVLQIVHGFPPAGRGGAELYAESVSRHLSTHHGDAVTVLTREHAADAPELRVRKDTCGGLEVFWINNTFRQARHFEDTYVNPRITALASDVIDLARPDVAHVHHLTCLSTTIVDELARRGVPVVLTLHDYWLLCHRGQLLDRTLGRCDGPGQDGCARCTGAEGGAPVAYAGARLLRTLEDALPAAMGARLGRLARRRADLLVSEVTARQTSLRRLQHMRDRFAHVSMALAPSAHVRERFLRAGFAQAPIVVSEYGVAATDRLPHRRQSSPPLRLGFLGALMASKAPHLLADAAAALPAGSVAIEIYGQPTPYHGDDTYVRDLDRRLLHTAIARRGPIDHADVPRVLASLDALVFPSIWEETSGIGAREALAAGVPVIASRLGGIPESVRDGVNGLLFTPGDGDDLTRQIRRLLDEPGLLDHLRSHCHAPRTLDDDVTTTRALYQDLARRSARVSAPRRDPSAVSPVAAVVLNYRTPDQTAMAAEMLLRSDLPLTPLIVVDNGDGADCGAALAMLDGQVELRATGRNLGFSGGCNAGIGDALTSGANAVLLVNSDVLVPPGCVKLLARALARQPRPGIVAPVVRSRVWPGRTLSAGIDYNATTGRMRHRLDPLRAEQVDAVSGCVMLVHRSVFERIGLLPEEYFFSFEDIAFCQRARAAGFDIGVEPRAAVYHEGSGTMGTNPRRLYFASRNHLRLGAHTPARSRWHRLWRQSAIAGYNIAHALTARGGTAPARLAAVARGIADHLRGRVGEG